MDLSQFKYLLEGIDCTTYDMSTPTTVFNVFDNKAGNLPVVQSTNF